MWAGERGWGQKSFQGRERQLQVSLCQAGQEGRQTQGWEYGSGVFQVELVNASLWDHRSPAVLGGISRSKGAQ